MAPPFPQRLVVIGTGLIGTSVALAARGLGAAVWLADSDRAASILIPAGAHGPAFLMLQNFRVIMKYNPAEAYALAIDVRAGGQVADRTLQIRDLLGGAEMLWS